MLSASRDDIRLPTDRCASLSSVACRSTGGTGWNTSDPQITGIALEARIGQDFRYVIGAAKDHRCLTSPEVSNRCGERTIAEVHLPWHYLISVLQLQQEFQTLD